MLHWRLIQSAEAPFALCCTQHCSAAWLSPLLFWEEIGIDAQQLFPAETGPDTARTCSLLSKVILAGADCSPTDTLTWCCRDSPTSKETHRPTKITHCLWQVSTPPNKPQANPKPRHLLTPPVPRQRHQHWDGAETPAACPAMDMETAHSRCSSQRLQGGLSPGLP